MTFERAHRENEVLDFAARIPVEDDGFGGALQDVVQILKTGGKVDGFDVGLAFARRIGQRTRPHAVEGIVFSVFFDFEVFDDQAAKTVVRLHDPDDRLGGDEPAETLHAHFGCRADRFYLVEQGRGIDALGVGYFDDLAALCLHEFENFFADFHVDAVLPVVTVYDVVWLELFQIRDVAPFVLRNDFGNVFQVFYDGFALLVGQERKTFALGNGFVGV